MTFIRTTLLSMLLLGVGACGRSENANNLAATDLSAGNEAAANASATSNAETAAANATKGMPVPGTNTTEKEVHDMNDMGNMDMNQMNHM